MPRLYLSLAMRVLGCVSACWGALALAGCTQQALTKLKKNVLPNDLGTEKVNSVSDKSSRSGPQSSQGGRVGARELSAP